MRVQAVAIALCLTSAGCISTPIDTMTPSLETLKLLRAQDMPPVALGSFTLADTAKSGRSVSIRGSTINAPKGKTFADFLKDTLAAELTASGKLDPASATVVSGRLLESGAGENIARGQARLSAEFSVANGGAAPSFVRTYSAESAWQSDFIGALAIPEAFRQYNALYAQLVRKLFADPEFVAALKA